MNINRDDFDIVCILGETEYDYLIYNTQASCYQLHDKVTDDSVATFATIEQAVSYMFI